MLSPITFSISWLAALSAVSASPYNARPLDPFLSARQLAQNTPANGLVVDLGYEQYQGVANQSTGLNTWKGIRFAAAPIGALRWQPPQPPVVNRGQVLKADMLPPRCPQSSFAPLKVGFNFTGNEDCLFLSVYAPQNKTNLPVFVYIHGGGYGFGQGNLDMAPLINTNNNDFIVVSIQYRLGAFGFLSSDEVYRYGTVNAGLKDMTFALQWTQSYIHLFGGNASAVTIGGESAGGGGVMLQSMAFGGNLGTSLFRQIITSSPYLPQQWNYGDFVPSQSYYAFAQAVGCFNGLPQSNYTTTSIFNCLTTKDTVTLQNASHVISESGRFGTWGFLPVTDGTYIQQLPSQQLLKKQVNGVNALVGNNANEGPAFTPQNIVTEADFVNFLQNAFPLFTEDDISKVLFYYPSSNASIMSTPGFATSGTTNPTAVNESSFGSGQQQRADNVYAETTFVCPSYWLTEAFTNKGRVGYKYQYSVIGAEHNRDLTAIFGPPTPNQSPDFSRAFMTIWGNFITISNPSISAAVAAGSANASSAATSAATKFPPFTINSPYQLNLNESGGTPYSAPSFATSAPNITQFQEPGLQNAFRVVNAYTWEGGRGTRCDFWRSVASIVPE